MLRDRRTGHFDVLAVSEVEQAGNVHLGIFASSLASFSILGSSNLLFQYVGRRRQPRSPIELQLVAGMVSVLYRPFSSHGGATHVVACFSNAWSIGIRANPLSTRTQLMEASNARDKFHLFFALAYRCHQVCSTRALTLATRIAYHCQAAYHCPQNHYSYSLFVLN